MEVFLKASEAVDVDSQVEAEDKAWLDDFIVSLKKEAREKAVTMLRVSPLVERLLQARARLLRIFISDNSQATIEPTSTPGS